MRGCARVTRRRVVRYERKCFRMIKFNGRTIRQEKLVLVGVAVFSEHVIVSVAAVRYA